ncbi:PspA/IM30 protein [Dioscorea alata]|uniref:PspA/IM30 protein n=1 Tax=Dioscorea alata TaxID=55571 RepID=A0ACB7WBA0_DIOAL|nr:PspA/IM30 protein [Dioscorea alata]
MPESVFFVHLWKASEQASRKPEKASIFLHFFSDFDIFDLGIRVSRMMMAMKVPVSGLAMASPSSVSMVVPGRRVLVANPASRTSFFNGGVGALKVEGLRMSNSNRSRCSGHGGGALGAQMNLFDRLARVIKSYANAILGTLEDPEKILEQAVVDMNNDLIKTRQATAQVLASQKRLENKYKAAQQASDDWYRRAQLALAKGDEDLAREALKRRKSFADNASSLKAQLDQQKGMVDNLVSNTRLLESKIQEARSKKDSLKARAQSAKTATKVTEMLGNVNTSSALAAFEKMEEKVMALESQAEALTQLSIDDLEGKFAILENSSVDDDLAQLKRELSGSSVKGELPSGRTKASSYPLRDIEIENELNELRRRAREY